MSEQNDRNLILKAAEVMGWNVSTVRNWGKTYAIKPTPHLVVANNGSTVLWPAGTEDKGHTDAKWEPLTLISDAWMLVERLRELGWDVSVDSFPGGYWSASFAHGNGGFSRMEGSDAPRAVTLAAIDAWEAMKIAAGEPLPEQPKKV